MTAKFPLYLHKSNQWAKTIRGKKYYFGTDKDNALKRYLEEKDYLLAGRTPPTFSGEATLGELINVYMNRNQRLVGRGEITKGNFSEICRHWFAFAICDARRTSLELG